MTVREPMECHLVAKVLADLKPDDPNSRAARPRLTPA